MSFKSTLAANSSIAALRIATPDQKNANFLPSTATAPISPPTSEDKKTLSDDGMAGFRSQTENVEPQVDYNGDYKFAPIKGPFHSSFLDFCLLVSQCPKSLL